MNPHYDQRVKKNNGQPLIIRLHKNLVERNFTRKRRRLTIGGRVTLWLSDLYFKHVQLSLTPSQSKLKQK